jgi:hypothetical protein
MGEPTYRSFSGSIKPKSVNFFFFYFFIFWRPSSPGTPSHNKGFPIEGEFQCCMEEKREESVNLNANEQERKKGYSSASYRHFLI